MAELNYLKSKKFLSSKITVQVIIILLTLQSRTSRSLAQHTNNTNTDNEFFDLNNVKSLRIQITNNIDYLNEIIYELDIWTFEKVENLTKVDELKTKLDDLETNIADIQYKIRQYYLDADNFYTDIISVKIKYDKLYNDLQKLRQRFDNNTYEGLSLINNYLFKPNISYIYDTLSSEMFQLNEKIYNKIQSSLTESCEREIIIGNVYKASIIGELIEDDSNIVSVVNRFYEQYKTINFGNSIRNISKSLLIYKSIFDSTLRYKTFDYFNEYLKMFRALENNIINEENASDTLKRNAIKLKNDLFNKIKELGLKKLLKTVDDEVFDFECLRNTFVISDELLFDIYFEFCLNETLAEKIDFNTYEVTKLSIVLRLFDYFQLDYNLALKMGNFINKILSKKILLYGSNLSSRMNLLSKGQNNIIKSRPVCLKNFETNEYLQTITFNGLKYYLFVNVNISSIPANYLWRFIHINNNNYIIKSVNDDHSYLDTYKDNSIYKSGNSSVFLSSDDNDLKDKHSIWVLELLADDYCFIKNAQYNQYLYSSKDTDYFVFIRPFDSKNPDAFKWIITSC
ncbi:hypothetical protein O3M35_007314 [Rhynocoris fuscipes]|uniref:Secreted protein n=1 Tax=Rhynocoris fuscipes TaxID=488301 RepID=A0AAW1DEQ0_9HEMI